MKFKILNRKDGTSLFKRGLNEVLKCKGDLLILAYGWISSRIKFNSDLTENTEFIKLIQNGFEGEKEKKITIVGSYQDNFSEFIKVAQWLDRELLDTKITLLIKDKKGRLEDRRYHKKVAVKMKNNKAQIALIGSSNLSKYTYWDVKEDAGYNHEIDILLWNSFEIDKDIESMIIKNTDKEKFKYLEVRDIVSKFFKCPYSIDVDLDLEIVEILEEITNYENYGFKIKYKSTDADEIKLLKLDKVKNYKEILIAAYIYCQNNFDDYIGYDRDKVRSFFERDYTYFLSLIESSSKEDVIEKLKVYNKPTLRFQRINGCPVLNLLIKSVDM